MYSSLLSTNVFVNIKNFIISRPILASWCITIIVFLEKQFSKIPLSLAYKGIHYTPLFKVYDGELGFGIYSWIRTPQEIEFTSLFFRKKYTYPIYKIKRGCRVKSVDMIPYLTGTIPKKNSKFKVNKYKPGSFKNKSESCFNIEQYYI